MAGVGLLEGREYSHLRQVLLTVFILIVFTGTLGGIAVSTPGAISDTDRKVDLQSEGTVITVGENGTYQRLQRAVDAAKPGDTVQVASGTYNPVWIDREVNLIGVNTGGGKPVIEVGNKEQAVRIRRADNVKVSGFYFEGEDNQGIHFSDGADSAVIVNNTFDVEVGFVLISDSDPHRVYANDFSKTSKVMAIYGEEGVDVHWNSTEKLNYWWDGDKRTGYLGNYYGKSVSDADGDGIADGEYEMRRYPWNNTDYHPLMDEPWKYFEKGVGESTVDTNTLTSSAKTTTEQPTDTSRETSRDTSETQQTTREQSTEDQSTTSVSTQSEEVERGFFSNSSGEPGFLSNALNLTVLGFLLSVAGILQQMMGGR